MSSFCLTATGLATAKPLQDTNSKNSTQNLFDFQFTISIQIHCAVFCLDINKIIKEFIFSRHLGPIVIRSPLFLANNDLKQPTLLSFNSQYNLLLQTIAVVALHFMALQMFWAGRAGATPAPHHQFLRCITHTRMLLNFIS